MLIRRAFARGTSNAAKTIPGLGGFGTLRVGAPADVAVLELSGGFSLRERVEEI